MSAPTWKKGKDGKDFAALAAANPMSSIVAELQASLKCSKLVATLSVRGGDAILGVKPDQGMLLNRAAFGRATENAGAEKQWFQLGPEEVFYLCHALKCIAVKSENKNQMSERELWDHLSSASESFPEMYKAYSHLRSKNWVVRSGLQYGANFVAYCHHPALVHSEFAVIVVPEGIEFSSRCGRLNVWSDLLCALRASGSVAKTLLVLTISSSICELSSPDCLEQLVVHERTITRWIPQQCREQRSEPCREEANMEVQVHTRESVVFNYWGVILTEWVGAPNAHSFSKLEHICCRACPKLCALPFLECSAGSYTHHLLELEINDCPNLAMPPMPHVSTLTSFLVSSDSSGMLYSSSPEDLYVQRYKGVLAFYNLDKAEIMTIEGVSHISLTELSKLKSLRTLTVEECDMTWHGVQDLTWHGLRSLTVKKCGNFFGGAPMSMKPFPASLRELRIYEEASMQSMSLLSNLTSLTQLYLVDCENLRVDGFNPLITAVNLKELEVFNGPNYPRSIAVDLLSEVVVAIRSNVLPAGSFRQLEDIEVDSISAVLIAPICTLLAATLRLLVFHYDDRVEGLREEEEKALPLLTSLQVLSFYKCPGLPSLPQGLHTLPCLRRLDVSSCPEIRSLPKGLPASLRVVYVEDVSAELKEQVQKFYDEAS